MKLRATKCERVDAFGGGRSSVRAPHPTADANGAVASARNVKCQWTIVGRYRARPLQVGLPPLAPPSDEGGEGRNRFYGHDVPIRFANGTMSSNVTPPRPSALQFAHGHCGARPRRATCKLIQACSPLNAATK